MRLALVIIIKKTFIGKFTPLNSAEKEKPWNRFRYWLMSKVRKEVAKNIERKGKKQRERVKKIEREIVKKIERE